MTQTQYGNRLTIQLTPQQFRELNEYIPWGVKKTLFIALVDRILDLFRRTAPEERVVISGSIINSEIVLVTKYEYERLKDIANRYDERGVGDVDKGSAGEKARKSSRSKD